MSVREYIGARYVPVFADPIQWDSTLSYEPLTVVTDNGTSYVSRQSVPPGTAIDNESYWVRWADYNAQLEEYIRQVQTYSASIGALNDALPIADFDDEATVKDAIDGLAALLPGTDFTAENTVKDAIDGLAALLPGTEFDSVNTVDARFDVIEANDWVTTDRIADGAVTNGKLGVEAVSRGNIQNDAVSWDEIDNKLLDTIISGTLSPLSSEHFCTADVGNVGYPNSMAYDPNSDTLYIASYNSNDTSTIRRYNNFINGNNAGETIEPADYYTFPNNHCNCMSFDNGKLYCWSWDNNYVDEVNFANKSYTRINTKVWLRGGAIKDGVVVLQPYSANEIFVSLAMHNVSPFLGMFNSVEVPAQVSYAQDAKLYEYCYCRLLSSGTYTNSYIEIIPYFATSSQPIVVPVPFAGEMEGLEIIGGNAYVINNGGEIYKLNGFENVVPQIINENFWASEIRLFMSNDMKSIGLPISKPNPETLDSDYTYGFLISIPEDIYQWTEHENIIHSHLEIHLLSSSGTYETKTVSLRLLGAANMSTVGPSGGSYTPAVAVRSLSDGIEFMKLIIAWDKSTVYSGEGNRHIFVAPTQRITIKASGTTISPDCSIITGIRAFLQ